MIFLLSDVDDEIVNRSKISLRWIWIDRKWCEQDQPYELCHKDFCNSRDQGQLIHWVDHKMIWIRYDEDKQYWKVTNQFYTQISFMKRDFKWKIWNLQLKRQKVRFLWDECPPDTNGYYLNYWQDHQQYAWNHSKLKKYKWVDECWKIQQQKAARMTQCELWLSKISKDKQNDVAIFLR